MDDLTTSFPIINNRYQIFSTIATGGMAVVYKAQDLILERSVALKVLKKDLSDDQAFQNRFRHEAKASAKLIHPNIITTFDFGFDKDRLYIVMEYFEGVELKELIKEPGGIQLARAYDLLIQACAGIAYAHQEGFIHCDLKPQNILVSAENILKITDFGIARAMDTISREEKNDVVWGSPYYISPEQASGNSPTPAADIYSMGVIAYELFTGQLPFIADDSSELVSMHKNQPPRPPKQINPEIPPGLEQVIMKCLSKDPVSRFQNGSELHRELNQLILPRAEPHTDETGTPAETINQDEEEPKKENGRLDLATILLSLLALIAVGGLIPFWLYVALFIKSLGR